MAAIDLDVALRLAEIVSIVGGGLIVVIQTARVGGRLEEGNKLQAKRLEALENDVKALNKVITEVAVQQARINNIERDLRELRHGEGFIFPLEASLRGPKP